MTSQGNCDDVTKGVKNNRERHRDGRFQRFEKPENDYPLRGLCNGVTSEVETCHSNSDCHTLTIQITNQSGRRHNRQTGSSAAYRRYMRNAILYIRGLSEK